MIFSNSIRLFWWNEIKLQKKKKENYGDLLGKVFSRKNLQEKSGLGKTIQLFYYIIFFHLSMLLLEAF